MSIIKKIAFILGFISLFLIVGVGGVRAAETYTKQQLQNMSGYPHYVEMGGDIYLLPSEGKLYNSDSVLAVWYSGTLLKYSYDNNIGAYRFISAQNVSYGHGFDYTSRVTYSTLNIYTDRTLKEVFYHAPKPVVLTAVEELPVVVKANLVDGGILLVALTVLAILLGIYLVPRFLYSFARSKL